MEKIVGVTPNGGDYFLIEYLDEHGNAVDKNNAVRCVITEYRNDGELLFTTYGINYSAS